MLIEMWHWFDEEIGVLVPSKTGITWTNQCGGSLCAHPEVEGFFLTLSARRPNVDPLLDVYGYVYDPELVDRFIAAADLEWAFEPLTREEAEAAGLDLMEAWVPVRVRKGPDDYRDPNLKTLAGRAVILTYGNSD